MPNIKPMIMNTYVDDHWLDICTSDITQLVCGMSAHLFAQGAFVYLVVHIVCQVDVIASVIFTILFDFK